MMVSKNSNNTQINNQETYSYNSKNIKFKPFLLFLEQNKFDPKVQMRPSPFTGKFKKRDIKLEKDKPSDKAEDVFEQQVKENQNNTLKPPSSKNLMKINKSKEKSKQKNEQGQKIQVISKDEEQGLQTKTSASFKPNLKLKAGKKIKLSAHETPGEVKPQDEGDEQQSYRPVLKPTLFRKGQNSERSNRQQVIVEEEQKTANVQQDSIEGSRSVGQSIGMAPKFKIKAKQDNHFPIIQEQAMEQTGFSVNNFGDMKIETREINMGSAQVKVSEVKIQRQKARVRQLKFDLYEETLNISCVTPYEIYINKIKSGSLINSSDQAFDEKSHSSTQTLTFEFQEFTNQCPQDFHTDANNIVNKDENEAFQQFISKLAPVFEQLIKPSTTVVMPPIFLLALRPEFIKLISCPYPVFLYRSPSLGLGIAVIGQKLYIVQNEIQTALSVGSFLVAGCKDGSIYLWTGNNDKRSRLYRKVLEEIQTTNFQLPQCSNLDLDRFSIYRSQHSIVCLLAESNEQFTSVDSNCKITRWRIVRNGRSSIKLEPEASYELASLLQRPNITAYGIGKRNETYFVSSSAGVLVWNKEEVIQRLDTEGFRVVSLALPHRTNFVYVACQDHSIRIYEEHYANQLFKIYMGGLNVCDIFVPETQYENKRLSLTSKIFVSTAEGDIYRIQLLSQPWEARMLGGGAEKKDRDVIYRGVNKLNEGFQLVTLWRDLKCTSEVRRMNVSTEPTVNNIKSILEENRQFHDWIQAQHSLTIVE